MKVGITGHQKRAGIDWEWVSHSISDVIASLGHVTQAYSSLAAGTDQVFAKCVLKASIPLIAVIPISNYERFFDKDSTASYTELLSKSRPVNLEDKNSPEESFFAAGQYIVRETDLLIAVWDEKPAEGLGGTGDVVDFARSSGKKVVILNPITKTIDR